MVLRVHPIFCNSFLAASFRSHVQRKESYQLKTEGDTTGQSRHKSADMFDQHLSLKENDSNSLDSTRSFGDTQLEIFNYRHGMLLLHLLAALMFVPSLVAWLQVFLL